MAETADNQSSEKDDDFTGQNVADYELIRRLGRGGMAEVWLAQHTKLNRPVALKLLKKDLASDQVYIQRFRIEAQAAARLVHPNIVQIYDVGEVEGLHYIAQEYVAGQNLREYLVKHGPPEVHLAVSIIRQVSCALLKAAEHGIIHRDIKPENIMLSRSGEIKVADFGLARVSGEGLNLTQVGMTMGTPLYMSPEQVEGRDLDPRSDIYSFGITCYHMLAGSPPFRGETALSVAVQHLKTRAEPLESQRPDLPPALCRMVHKMMSKDPAQRYASARDILRDLHALSTSQALGDAPEAYQDLSSLEFDVMVASGTQAANRLSTLMTAETQQLPTQRKAYWQWALAIGLGCLLGTLLALGTRERPLLARNPDQAAGVEKKATALKQYLWAMQLGSESGWRSVLEHFPENDRYNRLAKQQLARLYLRKQRHKEANNLFSLFAGLPDGDPLRTFGLAGKALLYHQRGQYEESQKLIVEIRDQMDRLDHTMRDLIQAAEQRNKRKIAAGG